MPLPAPWVDHLFAKLSVRWGAAFMRQWPDTDPTLVKADWAEVLDGCTGNSLSYAMRFLPASPCNALQFRDLCRRAPSAETPAITYDRPPADPRRVQQIIAGLRKRRTDGGSPARRCADAILAIADQRRAMSLAQVDQLRAMAHLLRPDQVAAAERFAPMRRVEEALS